MNGFRLKGGARGFQATSAAACAKRFDGPMTKGVEGELQVAWSVGVSQEGGHQGGGVVLFLRGRGRLCG